MRAFGQEPKQKKRYEKLRKEALEKGIADSWVNAGTTALTGYIDQAIGVLLLWYVHHYACFSLFWLILCVLGMEDL